MDCDHCGCRGSVLQFRGFGGEHTCGECGAVALMPVFVDDRTYAGDDAGGDGIFYGGVNDRCGRAGETELAIVAKLPGVSSRAVVWAQRRDQRHAAPLLGIGATTNAVDAKTRCIVSEALALPGGVMNEAVLLYAGHLAQTGARLSADKHMLLLAACTYVVSSARTIDEICGTLRLDTAEFHAMYKRLGVRRSSLSVDEGVKAVTKALFDGLSAVHKQDHDEKTVVAFRAACHRLHARAAAAQGGQDVMRQVKNTKLFAVIALLVCPSFKFDVGSKKVKDTDLFKILKISAPTVRKVKGLLAGLLVV